MNAGRVELDLVAVGKDQVTAMLRQVDAQLKKTAGEMGSLGTATAATGGGVVKSFKALREGAMYGAAAITGIVAGLVALVDAFSTNAEAIRVWEAAQKGVAKALETTDALIEQINIRLGKAVPKSEAEKQAESLAKAWEETNDLIQKGEAAADAYKESVAEIVRQYGKWAEATPAVQEQLKALARTETDLANLYAKQGLQLFTNLELMRERAKLASEFVGPPPLPEGSKLNFWGEAETPEQEAARKKRLYGAMGGGGGGGGGGSAPAPVPFQFHDIGSAVDRTGSIGIPSSGGPESEDDLDIEMMTTDAEKLAAAFDRVNESVGGLVGERFPELASALSEIQAISHQVADGQMGVAGAMAASGVAIAANVAKAIGGVKAEAAVRAAYEIGMGVASAAAYDYPAAAGHFLAAGLLGAVAVGGAGGKGGGGRSGGTSQAGSSGSSSGPTTVIYPIMFGDRQTVIAATRAGERSARGTGASSRAGV